MSIIITDEMPEFTPAVSRKERLAATAAAFSGLFSYAVTLSVAPASINSIGRSFGIGGKELAAMFFLFFSGFFIAITLGALCARRIGRQQTVVLGCVVMSLGCFVFGIAPSYPIALVAYFLLGFGGGITEPIGMSLISETYSGSERTAMMNYSQVAFGVGAIGAPLAVGWGLTRGLDWRMAFMLSAVICLVAAVTSCIGMRHKTVSTESSAHTKLSLKNPLLIALSVGMFFYVGAELGTASWLARYFKEELHSGAFLTVNTISIFWGGITVGRFAAGMLSSRFSDIAIIRVSLITSLVWQLILVNSHTPFWAAITIGLLGISMAAVFPTILAYAGGVFTGNAEAAFSAIVGAGCLGAIVLPSAIGALSDFTGWRPALAICPMLGIANILLFTLIVRLPAKSTSSSF